MDNQSPPEPRAAHSLRWIPEFWQLGGKRLRPQARLLGLSLGVGVIAGLGAVIFFIACEAVFRYSLDAFAGYRPQTAGGEQPLFGVSGAPFRPWLLLIVPTIGGLISGFIVYTFAPEAEGHGTDAVIDAYHRRQGFIRPRVPIVKIIASAFTLGTGGSGGREGPIAQIGAGFGSYLGTVLRLRPADRRILMAAGMGAGIAAIFRAPLAGALFAAEVLYRSPDFESEVIMPAALSSVIAYCTFGSFFGWTPLFALSPELIDVLTFSDPLHLVPYTILALFLVPLATLYTRLFYGTTHWFHRLAMPSHFKPAIGAFLTGAIGLALFFALRQDQQALYVLSFGYGILQDIMNLRPDAEPSMFYGVLLLCVAVGKIATTSLTIGSGGSAGVFGASMVIGGCGGGALGIFMHRLWPSGAPHPVAFVLIGMAGFFAAAAKTPFSTLVMVGEITGNYNLLLPTLWVCSLSFLLSDEQSIYCQQVESRSRSPVHQADFVRGVLSGMTIGQCLDVARPPAFVQAGDRLDVILERFSEHAHSALPVTDGDHRLLGVIRLEEAYLATRLSDERATVVAADLMRADVAPLHQGDSIDRAVELFAENDLPELPVVDDDAEPHVLGIVTRAQISRIYLKYVQGTGVQS